MGSGAPAAARIGGMFGRKPKTPADKAGEEKEKLGFIGRLRARLNRGDSFLTRDLGELFRGRQIDAAALEELESRLLTADAGVDATEYILAGLQKRVARKELGDVAALINALRDAVAEILTPCARPLVIDDAKKPYVILVVGVNGSGKTTTIGKLARRLGEDGRSVMLAAGDTFRAAAIDQLKVWGERTGAPVIARPPGSDAASLAFEAITEARAADTDVLIIDTAGRLHNRDELMSELEKIIRVIKKVDPSAPHATLLTLDATTGQNALNQVEIFGQRAGVTGLVMTKLDGTARGGILVAIAKRFGLPVHFIGVGEGVDDLEAFEAADFAAAIAGKAEGI